MTTPNDGGPAFPETRWDDKARQEVQWLGMTLRDYFAAKAMQALIGCQNLASMDEDAAYAYQQADAMLKAREQ